MSEKAFTIRYLCNSCGKEIQNDKVILEENGEYCSKGCQEQHEKELANSHLANCGCPCHEEGEPAGNCDCHLADY